MEKILNIRDHVKEVEPNKFEISKELMAAVIEQDIPQIGFVRDDGSIKIIIFDDEKKAEFKQLLVWEKDDDI